MKEINKNDLMFLQNEILGDIKKVENKLDSRIYAITESLKQQNNIFEKKISNLESGFNILKLKVSNLKNNDPNDKEVTSKINSLIIKTEDYYSKLDSRISFFQSNFQDACYKYDKAIMNYLQAPGLIGERCPYSSIRDFFENMHKKINESLRHKDQQSIDLKKYKEKMDIVITQNKSQLSMFESRITNYFDSQIKDIDNKYKERIDIIEERINNMRIENGKYSNELIEKCNELENKFSNIDNIIQKSLNQYNEEIAIFKNTFKEMNIHLKNFEEHYNIFQEKFKMIDGLNEIVNKNFNKYDSKINEIIKVNDNMHYDENNNKSNCEKSRNIKIENNIISKSNYNEYRNINEDKKQNKIIDDPNENTINLKGNDIKLGIRKKNNRNNLGDMIKKYNKKKETFFDENNEFTNINNIVFDSGFFKKSNNRGNFYINDYFNKNYKIDKKKKIFNRIKSGKIIHRFPFITNEDNIYDEQINYKNIKNNSLKINKQRNNIFDEYLNESEKLKEEYESKKEYNISRNKNRSQEVIKQKVDNNLNENYFPPGHRYLYLDRKINILSNAMVDNINKLIIQINYLKQNYYKNINQINSDEKTNDKPIKKNNIPNSLFEAKTLFYSPSYFENSNCNNEDKKRNISQK